MYLTNCTTPESVSISHVLHTHTSQQSSNGLNISSSEDVGQRIDHRETQGVDTDPPLSCKRKNVLSE